MNYFLIFLLQGKVINICSFDELDSLNREQARLHRITSDYYTNCGPSPRIDGKLFDEWQTLEQLK